MIKWWHIVICGCILLAGVWTGLMIAPSVMAVQIISYDTTSVIYEDDSTSITLWEPAKLISFVQNVKLQINDTVLIQQPLPQKQLPQLLVVPSFKKRLTDWWFAVTRPPCQ